MHAFTIALINSERKIDATTILHQRLVAVILSWSCQQQMNILKMSLIVTLSRYYIIQYIFFNATELTGMIQLTTIVA